MERVELQKSVHNIPTHEEYFGLVDNIIEDWEFESDNDDDDIKKMLVVMLALLQEFYIEHMYDTAYYYASEQFKEDINSFNDYLKDNLLVLFTEYVLKLSTDLDAEWKIPTGTVSISLELEEIINSGLDSVITMLYYDLKDKADFYTKLALTTGSFSPHSNFRRAIKKLTNQIDFKGHHIQKVINRKYDEFVYGQDAQFYWVCSGINTCAWCYEIESVGAMPLSWFPLDHINGRCVLKPVYPDVYSEEYKRLIE